MFRSVSKSVKPRSDSVGWLFKNFINWRTKFCLIYKSLKINILTNLVKILLKNLLKKFANPKNCRTFVSGMRKQGSLDGIILLVISFSVINYVVSKSVRLRQADTLFLCPFRFCATNLLRPEKVLALHSSVLPACSGRRGVEGPASGPSTPVLWARGKLCRVDSQDAYGKDSRSTWQGIAPILSILLPHGQLDAS